MNKSSDPTTATAQNDKKIRTCERCGRERPANTERFAVTASDFTDATADFERALLCEECWRQFRDEIWRLE